MYKTCYFNSKISTHTTSHLERFLYRITFYHLSGQHIWNMTFARQNKQSETLIDRLYIFRVSCGES